MLKFIDSNEGFTIVEVLIVLAIAGIILLILFLAVPTLQRASRNNTHRAAAVYIFQAYSDWLAAHGISNFGESQPDWVVNCGTTDSNTQFCQSLKSSFGKYENNILAYGSTGSPPPLPAPTNDQLILSDFAKCSADGTAPVTTNQPRDIVMLYSLETASGNGATHCLANTASTTSVDFSY